MKRRLTSTALAALVLSALACRGPLAQTTPPPAPITPTATQPSPAPPRLSPTPPAAEPTPSPEPSPTPSQPAPTVTATVTPTPRPGSITFAALRDTIAPTRDLRAISMALSQQPVEIPITTSEVPANHQLGDMVSFWASNVDTNETFQVDAELVYVTDHLYFFADPRSRVRLDQVQRLAEAFEGQIYPTNRAFFGSEWTPGVDGDARLYLLYTRGLGFSVAGYYSSSDQYSRLAHEYSNEKEMFYINADTVSLGTGYLESVLAHEFQHMIHWANDSNEETWVNEGAAELASFLNGYGGSSFASAFVAEPDTQLNAWSEDGRSAAPHYGAGFLFLAYFLDRFGEQATRSLIANPANGLAAVDATLATLDVSDPDSGEPITAVDVVADWVVANYLLDPDVGDGRYFYHNYPQAPGVRGPTVAHTVCPTGTQRHTVHQYAADYHAITCEGEFTLHFRGATHVRVVPANARSGDYAFWSNRQDNSAVRLTRRFDLTAVDSATLDYWTWYAIEEDYDYAYLQVSLDGKRWTIVRTPSGSMDDPTGNNLGWGYNGFSGGQEPAQWIRERVDLTPYAGQVIWLRFEYVTDDAVSRAGLLLDDVAIPEIAYFENFETGAAGWQAEGFVRIDNLLPQTFRVQLIRKQAASTTVERLALDERQIGQASITSGPGESVTVVVSGTTSFTNELADYELEVR